MICRVRVWTAPLLLGLASGVGLISALVGDGVWDTLSWLCLGLPVVVAGWYVKKAGAAR